MAVSTAVVTGFPRDTVTAIDITATADADTTTGAVAHGLTGTPFAIITPTQAPARISLWVITAIDGTNFTATKATTAGSGVAGAQVRIFFFLLNAFCSGRDLHGVLNPFALTQ